MGYPKKVIAFDWTEDEDHVHVECRREGHTRMTVNLLKGGVASETQCRRIYVCDPQAVLGENVWSSRFFECPSRRSPIKHRPIGSACPQLLDGPHDRISVLGPKKLCLSSLTSTISICPLGQVWGAVPLFEPSEVAVIHGQSDTGR